MVAPLLLLVVAVATSAAAPPAIEWFVDPLTVQVPRERRAPFPSSAKVFDFAEMRGGCERKQLWLRSDEATLQGVTLEVVHEGLLPGSWAYKQQGYVKALPSDLYLCNSNVLANNSVEPAAQCKPGWYPDVLLDVPADGIPLVEKGITQPIMLEVCIARTATSGNFSGSVLVRGQVAGFEGGTTNFSFSVPVLLEVWPLTVPALNNSKAFSTTFNFGSTGALWGLQHWYPQHSTAVIWAQWFPFLARHRIPGDALYTQPDPRPTEELQVLADSGAKHMNLLYGVAVPNTTELLERLAPTITNLTQLGLIEKAYLYGFDENPQTNASIAAILDRFGRVKQRWPTLRTHATLNWPSLDDDWPIDTWINEFGQWGSANHWRDPTPKSEARKRWLAAKPGRKFWWYWCFWNDVGAAQHGHDPAAVLNTFVERPVIQSRLLLWLASLHAVDGMLYYHVNQWVSQCDTGHGATPNAHARPCTPVRRIVDTALTDFDPRTTSEQQPPTSPYPLFNGVNGGGSLSYPGEMGPLASNRLIAIADGIEDWELFHLLGVDETALISKGGDLITQLVRNHSDYSEDAVRMERVRREAARRIITGGKGPSPQPPSPSPSPSPSPQPLHHLSGPFAKIFSAGEGNFSSFRIPALVALPGPSAVAAGGGGGGGPAIIIAYSEARGPQMSDASDDCSKHLLSKRSLDGGESWDQQWLVIASAPNLGPPGPGAVGIRNSSWVGNAVPIYDSRAKAIVVVFCQNNDRLFVVRSTNHGRSYTAAAEITAQVKKPGWPQRDWSVFTGPAGGLQVANGPQAGRLVVPAEICTDPAATGLTCVGGAKSFNYALLSDDSGTTWHVGEAVPAIQPMARGKYDTPYRYSCEMNVAEVGNSSSSGAGGAGAGVGSTLVAIRRNPEHPALSFSSDSGASWTVPPSVELSIDSADCKPGIVSVGAGGPLVVSTPWSAMNVPANNLSLSVSSTGGSSGGWAQRVSFGGSVDYSSLTALGDNGDIAVLFEVPNTDGYLSGKLMDWDLAFQRVNGSFLS